MKNEQTISVYVVVVARSSLWVPFKLSYNKCVRQSITWTQHRLTKNLADRPNEQTTTTSREKANKHRRVCVRLCVKVSKPKKVMERRRVSTESTNYGVFCRRQKLKWNKGEKWTQERTLKTKGLKCIAVRIMRNDHIIVSVSFWLISFCILGLTPQKNWWLRMGKWTKKWCDCDWTCAMCCYW